MRHEPRRSECFRRFLRPLTAVGLLLPASANQSSGPAVARELIAAELMDPASQFVLPVSASQLREPQPTVSAVKKKTGQVSLSGRVISVEFSS
jgi:hypothetical protein